MMINISPTQDSRMYTCAATVVVYGAGGGIYRYIVTGQPEGSLFRYS